MEKITFLQNGQWQLSKGVNQRLAPTNVESDSSIYGAKDTDLQDSMQDWIQYGSDGNGDNIDLLHDTRNKIPAVTKEGAFRLANKLSRRTLSRLNPETKKREILLHRGMGEREHKSHINGDIKGITSWTPNINTALKWYHENGNHFISAWVPEDQIHNSTKTLHHHRPTAGFQASEPMEYLEQEVFIKPHKVNMEKDPDVILQAANRWNSSLEEDAHKIIPEKNKREEAYRAKRWGMTPHQNPSDKQQKIDPYYWNQAPSKVRYKITPENKNEHKDIIKRVIKQKW